MDQDIEKAYEQFEEWVSKQSYMWNVRHRTEYTGQFTEEDGTVCYMFKFGKMPGGPWRLGIVSNSHAYSISREYVSSTQTEDAELTLLYLNHNLEVNNMRDAMMEKYKDYRRGTYKSMSLQEKMELLEGVQQEFIPIFDEDGGDMDTWVDFHSIQREFKENYQMFTLENMVTLMHMLDDECFELDMMHQLVIIIRRIAVHYGTEGITFLLEHFNEVPRKGLWHGQYRIMQWLMTEEYFPLLKEAVLQCVPTGREQLLAILEAYDFAGQEECAEELKVLCTTAGD